MKPFVTIPKIILVLCILIPTISNAQKVELNKEFSFDENSKTESFTFKVEKGTKKLNIDLEGIISKGGLKVKILDPDGKQVSGFSLETSKSKDKSYNSSSDSGKKEKQSSSSSSRSSENASVSVRASSSSRSSSSSNSNSASVAVNSSGESETHNTHIYTKEKTENNDAGARGVINKEITNPTEGTWKFTIYPDNTSGHLTTKISYK